MDEQQQRTVYMQTAVIAHFLRWLSVNGYLRTDFSDDAPSLGERFFEETSQHGLIPEEWRDHAHVDLFESA